MSNMLAGQTSWTRDQAWDRLKQNTDAIKRIAREGVQFGSDFDREIVRIVFTRVERELEWRQAEAEAVKDND